MNAVSLRTRIALATLALILCILALFYAAGRYVVVSTVRDAEASVADVRLDIQRAITRELTALHLLADELAEQYKGSLEPAEGAVIPLPPSVDSALEALSREHDLGLVLYRRETDGKVHAFFRDSRLGSMENVPAEAFADYLRPGSPLLRPRTVEGACAGLVSVQSKMALAAVAPVADGGRTVGILAIGRFLDEQPLRDSVGLEDSGLRVHVMVRPKRQVRPSEELNGLHRVSPVLGTPHSFVPGGAWHVGRDAFETLVTLRDFHGDAVGALSIGLPGTLTTVANDMLDQLLIVVCGVGLIITVLVFYGTSRVVVSPLASMTRTLVAMAEKRTVGSRLNWPRHDEFGKLAGTLDGLLDQLEKDALELTAREEQNLALLAAVPDVFCVFGTDGVLKSMNCGNLSRRRLTDRLKVGETIASANLSKDSTAAFASALEQGTKDRAIVSLVFPGQRPEDDLYIECRIVRLDESSVLAVFRDMTEEHAARRQVSEMESRLVQLQRHESLGHLVAGIAHDFNDLLGVIQTSLEKHQRAVEPFIEDYGDLMAVSQAAKHASELIGQLQMYAGISDMTFELLNLNSLLTNHWALLRASVPHHIALELEKAAHLPDFVADATQMLQVVSNLLLNASEAIGDNPGTIHMVTRLVRGEDLVREGHAPTKDLDDGWYVQLTVTDNGRGIAPSNMNRILEPFFSTKGEGRGLGLATVAGILEAHDGVLSVTSQLGKGSSFHVFLPAPISQQAAAEPLSEAAPEETAQPTTGRRLCILLVDDDTRIRSVTRLLIESLQCDVLEAEQEREARLMMQKHLDRIDLLLLDANIRGMDGLRALRMIRQKAPTLPTFLISGHDEQQVRRVFEGVPYDGFIQKPFTREMLAKVLEQVRGMKGHPHGD